MRQVRKSISIGLLGIFLFSVTPAQAGFYGEVKTGLHTVASDKYGYALYVPEDYSTDRDWPMLIVLQSEGEIADEYIQKWLQVGKETGTIVFAPNYPILIRGMSYEGDEWILNHKHNIETYYAIDEKRVFLAGSGTGGHYALHMALKYPQEFTALASIGNAFEGKYEKVFDYSFGALRKIPIFVIAGPADNFTAIEGGAQNLKERGYSVSVKKVQSASEASVEAAGRIAFDWFRALTQETQKEEAESPKGFKANFFGFFKDLFEVY